MAQHLLPNDRHEQFAVILARTGNAAHAYRIVYPDAGDGTVRTNSHRLAHRPDVQRRVAELREQQRRALLEKTADLDALVSNLALGKGAELVDEDGRPVPIERLPEHVKLAISGLEIETTTDDEGERVTKYKLKFPDPLAAARLLAQLRGALIDRKDITSGGQSLAPEPTDADLERAKRRWLEGDVIEGEYEDISDLV